MSGVLAATVGVVAAGSAQAATAVPADTSGCAAPKLAQPFISIGDSNLYTLVPGQTVGVFDGGGWTLSGGARVASSPLADGTAGRVLDLPGGSSAVSPPMCVASDYPSARTMVRNVTGAQGVHFSVSYAGTKSADQPTNVGQVHGTQSAWTVSNPFHLHPGNLPGWQTVQFTITAGGRGSDVQIYDFWVDPRMGR